MLIRLTVVIVSQYGSLCYILEININISFQVALVVKNLPANEENSRSPGVENANPLQYSCLENSMDRRAWRATDHGITKSWMRQSTHPYTHTYI